MDLIENCAVENMEWVFCGKRLAPQRPDDARILADPIALVWPVERVFTRTLPLHRAILRHD